MTLTKDRRSRRIWQRPHRIVTTFLRFCIISLVPSIEMHESSTNSSNCYTESGMPIMANVVQDQPLPDGYTTPSDSKSSSTFGPKERSNEWGALINHHSTIITLAVFVGIIAIAIPIIGLCFYVCRYGYGRFGGWNYDLRIKKNDKIYRIIFAVLLVLLAIGVLICVIYIIGANGYFYMGLREKKRHALLSNAESDHENRFMLITYLLLNHTLVTNYDELTSNLYSVLNDTSIIDDHLRNSPGFLAGYKSTLSSNSMENIFALARGMHSDATQILDMTRSIRRDLLDQYGEKALLKEEAIFTLENNVGILSYPLPQIMEFELHFKDLDLMVKTTLSTQIDVANTFLEQLKKSWRERTVRITEAFQKAGLALGKPVHLLDELDVVPTDKPSTGVKTDLTDEYRRGGYYCSFRFFTSLIVCTVLLLVLLGLVTGLLFGLCGRPPGRRRNSCCNRATGALFLMLVVALIIFFSSLLAVVAFVHFLQGIIAFRVICEPLEPATTKATATTSSYQLLAACRKQNSIYNILNVQNITMMEEIQQVNRELDNLDQLSINVTARNIEDAGDVSDIKYFDRYDLGSMIKYLNSRIEEEERVLKTLGNSLSNNNLLQKLRKRRDIISNNIMNPIKDQGRTLQSHYDEVKTKYEHNGHTFHDSIELIFSELDDLHQLEKDAPIYMQFLRSEFNIYTDMVNDFMLDHNAVCYVMAINYRPSYTYHYSICCGIVAPFVTFAWVTLMCILILLLPILLVAILLANLFRKPKLKPGYHITDDRSSTSIEESQQNRTSTREGYARNSELKSVIVHPNEPYNALGEATTRSTIVPTERTEFDPSAAPLPAPLLIPRESRRPTERRSTIQPRDSNVTIHMTESENGISNYTRVDIGPEDAQTRRSTFVGPPQDRRSMYARESSVPVQVTRTTIVPDGTQTRRSTVAGPQNDRRSTIYGREAHVPTQFTRVTIGPDGTQTRRSTIGPQDDRRSYTRTTTGPPIRPTTQERRPRESSSLPERRPMTRESSSPQARRSTGQTRRGTVGPSAARRSSDLDIVKARKSKKD